MVFATVGCMPPSIIDDIVDNKFVQTMPEPVPPAMVGYWTGSLGRALSTFYWRADGTGEGCYTSPGKDLIERLKYRDKTIFIQSGGRMEVLEITSDAMTLRFPYFGNSPTKFVRDTNLTEASPYCSKALAGK